LFTYEHQHHHHHHQLSGTSRTTIQLLAPCSLLRIQYFACSSRFWAESTEAPSIAAIIKPYSMAPTRPKKRQSNESATSLDIQSFPTPPQLIPTKARSPARTPTNRSPIRKPKMRITVTQKQALIDNLQLESQS
jgi:hypothetical protein